MNHLAPAESLQAFHTLFTSAKREMFKAEVLQDYTGVDDSPSLRAWLDGHKQQAQELGRIDQNIISYRKQCLESPAAITRIHIVQKPYTPYLEWEIAVCYKDSLLAYGAELVLLTDIERLGDIELPAGDFWIFDDKRALQWEYENSNGNIVGAKLWDEDQGDDINSFRQLRKALLSKAEPVS